MSGSAFLRSSHLTLLLVATLAATVAPNTAAADSREGAFPPELWGVAANASFRSPTFARSDAARDQHRRHRLPATPSPASSATGALRPSGPGFAS